MKRYKLDTGLWSLLEYPEFATDQEAWESLRHKLPNKYATLYREEKVPILINNSVEYLESYNSKYTLQIIPTNEIPTRTIWLPILVGITSQEWNVENQPPFK